MIFTTVYRIIVFKKFHLIKCFIQIIVVELVIFVQFTNLKKSSPKRTLKISIVFFSRACALMTCKSDSTCMHDQYYACLFHHARRCMAALESRRMLNFSVGQGNVTSNFVPPQERRDWKRVCVRSRLGYRSSCKITVGSHLNTKLKQSLSKKLSLG